MSAEGEVEVLKWGHGLGAMVTKQRSRTDYGEVVQPSRQDSQGARLGAVAEQQVQAEQQEHTLWTFLSGFLGR